MLLNSQKPFFSSKKLSFKMLRKRKRGKRIHSGCESHPIKFFGGTNTDVHYASKFGFKMRIVMPYHFIGEWRQLK